MKRLSFFVLCSIFLLAAGMPCLAQETSKLTSAETYYPFLKWLASPGLEGRETGSKGAAMAADSIAVEMRLAGLEPWNQSVFTVKDSLSGYFQLVTFRPAADSLKENIGGSNHRVEDTIVCRNVIGVLPGEDTTETVIIGAHYDHLGIRDGQVFPGADDNASGVAGLLALAADWTRSGTKPPCNIIFAAWTSEEKGHQGSQSFVSSLAVPRKVKLYINMDMISRSESADSTRSKLSIGTRTADEYLRETAQKCNILLDKPFQLDLWDVTGAHGSDYASFTAAGIPILTFNTGLHEDYHTPRDVPEKIDPEKMDRVLELIDQIFRTLYPE